jgi:hypothetical protein
MFHKSFIEFDNAFEKLSQVKLQQISNGRFGAVLIDCVDDNKIPIVRTTTPYSNPAIKFKEEFRNLANGLRFNNVLIELYNHKYKTMGFHSDQELDLAEDSYIGIYSCYKDSMTNPNRNLIIKNKITGEEKKIILDHNSLIYFSTKTNREYLHKIELEKELNNKNEMNQCWMGMTFRLSKTFVEFKENQPYIEASSSTSSLPLRLACSEMIERKSFYEMRKREKNNSDDYKYPPNIDYSISPSDLMRIGSE